MGVLKDPCADSEPKQSEEDNHSGGNGKALACRRATIKKGSKTTSARFLSLNKKELQKYSGGRTNTWS